jgi:hypothetical protein
MVYNMQPTLTLQEEELARSLKAQGKSTQEILGAIAQTRTSKITPPRQDFQPTQSTARRVIQDIPSDFMEMGQNVRGSIRASGERLAGAMQDPNANLIMKAAAVGPQLGKSVLDVAGEAIVGYGKMLTTDEFEKSVAQKIGEVGETVASTETVKKLSDFRNNLSPQARFVLDQIIAPTAEVMFEGVTVGAGTAATQPLKRGLSQVGESIATEAGRVSDMAQNLGSSVGMRPRPTTPIQAPLPPEVQGIIVRAYDTAIKPNLASKQTPAQRAQYETQVSQAVESITNNVENLRLLDEATGETISKLPENLKEFVDALEQTKQAVFKQYDDLAAQAGETGARVDTIRAANELDSIINSKALKLSNPEAVRYAEEVRGRLLDTKMLSTLDAQDVIRNYNNSLEAFYRNPTPEGLSRNAVDALVANQLRRSLDDEIEAITGANYQGLKREYGALKAVERDIMRAYNRDARRNQKGLIDFTDVLTGGQVVSGILSMNPAAIGQGIAGKAIAGAIKMINDPNRKVRQIFQEAGRFRRPDTGMQMPTRRQLPPARPDAPRSAVGSGAPIVAGGQTPAGRVDVGGTERVREGAVRRSDSEPMPTELEKVIAKDRDAVDQAFSEIDAELSGDIRTSFGDNLVQSADGGYYRFNELPSWIPKELRNGDLMARVLRNINEGRAPRANASQEMELQELVQARINARINEIKNAPDTKGVFSADTAFAAALMAGGTYYMMSEDGSFLPVVAGMAIASNPLARGAAAQQIRNHALMLKKNIADMEAAGKQGTPAYKQKVKAYDAAMAEKLKIEKGESFNQGATPPTTLLEEAKKYKSAEEFVKSLGKPYFHGAREKWSGEFKQPKEGEYLTEAIFVAPSETSAAYYDRGGGVKKVFIDPKARLWDYKTDTAALEGLKNDKRFTDYVEKKWNYTIDEAIEKVANGEYDWVQRPEVLAYLRKNGYDGFVNIDHGGGETIGIFSNKKVVTEEQIDKQFK